MHLQGGSVWLDTGKPGPIGAGPFCVRVCLNVYYRRAAAIAANGRPVRAALVQVEVLRNSRSVQAALNMLQRSRGKGVGTGGERGEALSSTRRGLRERTREDDVKTRPGARCFAG